MADNSAIGNWIYAPGGLKKSGKKTKICKAFAAAVRLWCKGDPSTAGKKFADVFYDAGGKGLGEIGRETAVLTEGTGEAAKALGTVDSLASEGDALASTLKDSLDEVDEVAQLGSDGLATDVHNFDMLRALWSTPGTAGKGLNFADGQLPGGQLLELKSPMDKFQWASEAIQRRFEGRERKAVGSRELLLV